MSLKLVDCISKIFQQVNIPEIELKTEKTLYFVLAKEIQCIFSHTEERWRQPFIAYVSATLGKVIYKEVWTGEAKTDLKTSVIVILSGLSTGGNMFCMVKWSERTPFEVTGLNIHHRNPPKPLPKAWFWELVAGVGINDITTKI
jgi:hypothetical protein